MMDSHATFTMNAWEGPRSADMIFVTPTFIRVKSLLEMPNISDPGVSPALPNSYFPSDHIRIEAVLEIL
jgi:hypothetical protein